MVQKYDCVIIGSGVTGMTAAIYLKRANAKVLIIESSAPGGQVNKTAKIENYPGISDIEGPVLAMNMYQQVNNLNVDYKYGQVKNIDQNKNIIMGNDEIIETKTIIIASGRRPKELNIPGEKQFVGRGISWCALCDGFFYKDKEVSVIGGGNSAVEDAIYLSSICKKVTIISKYQELKAEKLLIDQLDKISNIEIVREKLTTKIIAEDNKLIGIELDNKEVINVEGIFIHIGHIPNTDFITFIDKENNYIKVNDKMETNVKGIFAAGDVIKKDIYQIVTGLSEGAIAAINAKREIDKGI